MNQPIRHLVLAGTLSIACNLAVIGAEPEKSDRRNSDRDGSQEKKSSATYNHDSKEGDQSPQGFVRAALLGGLKEVRMSEIAMERSESTEVKTFAQRMIQDHTKLNNQLMQLAQRKSWTVPPTNVFQSPYPSVGAANEPRRENGLYPRASDSSVKDRNKTDVVDNSTTDRERRDLNSDGQTRGKDVKDKQTSESQWDRMQMQSRTSIEGLKNTPTAEFDKAYAREVLRGHTMSVQKYEAASMQSTDEEIRSFAKDTLPQLKEHHRQANQLAQKFGVSMEHREGRKTSSSDFDKRKPE